MPRKEPRIRIEKGLYRSGEVYWACATAPGDRTARWHRIGLVGVQAARRARDEFAYELKQGRIDLPREKLTLRELAEEWFERLDELVRSDEIRPRTRDSYRSGLNLHVLPALGSRDVGTIDPDTLVAWHDAQRATGAAAWSIRARWMSLRGVLSYAARAGHITSNPANVLLQRERPKPGRARNRYLSQTEISALVADRDETSRTIASLLIFTGARASELLGLCWEDIDFATGVIKIRQQMSRQGQLVPLKTAAATRDVILMDALAQVLRRRKLKSLFSAEAHLVLANGVGNSLGYTRLRKSFAAATAAARVAGATPHSCRHTFASLLIDQGASVEFVAQQLGHASTKTTWDIYVHLFRAREQASTARRELDAAYGHIVRSGEVSAPDA